MASLLKSLELKDSKGLENVTDDQDDSVKNGGLYCMKVSIWIL